MSQKPNILFILTDDQRYDTIHALGNPIIRTPNLDRLAARGTAFTQAHIPSGTCGAVCMPSRAMLNTSRNPFHLQELGQDIPQSHTTLGEAYRADGYQTLGVGKWHNGPPAYARSFTGGGSIFFGGMWDHWNVPTSNYDPSGAYDNKINFVVNFFGGNKLEHPHCDQFVPGKHSSELLTDTAIELLGKAAEEEDPFLLYLAYMAPHDPRTMPEEYKAMYPPEDIPLPESFQEKISMDAYPLMDYRDEQLAAYPREPEEVKRQIGEYYGMISHLDHEIGRLLDALEASGKADNTIVVFAADNGLSVGQHGFMGKEDLYDHSIRVPLILAGPGIPENARSHAYVYLMDIYPTLCQLTGTPVPPSVEGESFAHVLRTGARHRETLYFAFDQYIRGVKDERFKLMVYAVDNTPQGRAAYLYDLQKDPNETVNLIDRPEYRPEAKRLWQLLCSYRDNWDELSHEKGTPFWQRIS